MVFSSPFIHEWWMVHLLYCWYLLGSLWIPNLQCYKRNSISHSHTYTMSWTKIGTHNWYWDEHGHDNQIPNSLHNCHETHHNYHPSWRIICQHGKGYMHLLLSVPKLWEENSKMSNSQCVVCVLARGSESVITHWLNNMFLNLVIGGHEILPTK